MMSTMNFNTKTRQSNRGRQSASSSNHSSRSGSKRVSAERFLPEGVYGNPRFTHVIYSLVGCVVQVQVKNGCIYEGVFKTISPDMNVVLELAHKVEDSRSSIPSKDRLIEKLIFGKDDVISLSATNVDLEFAVKDTFTDAAITSSRFNGQSNDKDVRELQPWEGEVGDDVALTETDSANGWDPNEMFKTNAEQFSVTSTYDENLTQYTTPLEKKDTKEYKQREEEAARLAKEIEKSDDYKKRIELENGDGDEEAKFSSVVRTAENRGPVGNGSGKYIPPHNRRGGGGGSGGVPPRRAMSDHGGPRQISPHKSHPHPPVASHMPQQVPPGPAPSSQPSQEDHIPSKNSSNVNGEREPQAVEAVVKSSPEVSTMVPSALPSGNVPQQQSPVAMSLRENVESPPNNNNSVNTANKTERRNANPRGRQIAELREFGENFKLTEELKDRKLAEKEEERQMEEESKEEPKPNKAAGSKLNPNAAEFVPTGQPKVQKPVPQTPTPPRPQTQSPVVPQPLMYSHQYILPGVPANMVPVAQQTAQPQGNRYPPKRAVVSLTQQPRQDYTAAAHHVAGQPLLANAAVPTQQYLPYMPSAAGYQMMPVTANHQRMVNQGPVGSSHPAGMDPTQQAPQQAHAQHIFLQTGHGPMPAHMLPHGHPQPAHVGTHPVPGNHQAQGQMTPVSGPHPASSPVQHAGPGGQQHHPQGPPTSGTPQPQLNYPQLGLQGHHQIQAASHNPASPQAAMPFALTSHPHIQQQQFTFTQAAQQPTSVSQTVHTHTHSPHMHPQQIVVMSQPPPLNQHHVPHPQFQHGAHPHGHGAGPGGAGPPMQGPGHVHGQGNHMMPPSGIPSISVSAPSGVHPSSMHFVPPVPSHAQGGHVQAGYPQAQ